MYQLSEIPEEWESHGYIQTRPYNYEQTFKNCQTGEIMTEKQMLAAGIIYQYIQIDKYTRQVIK